MIKKTRVVNDRAVFNIYHYFDDQSCLVYTKKGDNIFIEDRYNLENHFLSPREIIVFSCDYYPSIRKAMGIAGSRFPFLGLNFVSRPLNSEEWRKKLLWESSGLRIYSSGKIGVRYWPEEDSSPKWIELSDINKAIRMQEHILPAYLDVDNSNLNEIELLYFAREVLLEAKKNFLFWDKIKKPERKKTKESIRTLIVYLENCRNKEKVNMREQAEKIFEFKDKLERENPSALAARCTGALNSILRRLKDVDGIVRQISFRRKLLIDKKNKALNHLEIITKILESLLRAQPLNPSNYLPGLYQATSFLQTITFHPFLFKALQSKIILRELQASLSLKTKTLKQEEILEKINLALKEIKSK